MTTYISNNPLHATMTWKKLFEMFQTITVYSMHYCTGSLVSVHLPSGDVLSFALKKTEKATFQLSDLKEYIYSKTGIPVNSQKLFYKNKLLVLMVT